MLIASGNQANQTYTSDVWGDITVMIIPKGNPTLNTYSTYTATNLGLKPKFIYFKRLTYLQFPVDREKKLC